MRHDFTPDAAAIRAFLARAAEKYTQQHSALPRKFPLVTRVDVAFLVGTPSVPVLYVDFDTRPGAELDGDATHRCFAELQLPQWERVMRPERNEVLIATMPDGSEQQADDDGIDRLLGRVLVEAFKAAAGGGAFDTLPMTPDCDFGITYEGCPLWSSRQGDNIPED